MAAAGPAIIFVVLIVATTIATLYLLAYVARCIWVIVTATATGQDSFSWPEEPIVDWLGQVVALVGVMLIWLFPAGLLSSALSEDFLPGNSVLRTFLFCILSIWLFFPLGTLSSLSSVSHWVFFRPLILGQMLVLLPATLVFYGLSAVVLLLGFAPLGWVLLQNRPLFLIPAVIPAAMAVLVHARLIGRLGAMIRHRVPFLVEPESKPKKKSTKPRPRIRTTPDPDTPFTGEADHVYSEEIKNRIVFEEDGDVTAAYGLGKSDQPPPQPEPEKKQRPSASLDPEDEDSRKGYSIDDQRPSSGIMVPQPGQPLARSKTNPRTGKPLLKKKKAHPPPGIPSLFQGVLNFPFYGCSIQPMINLSIGFAVASGVFLACLAWFPF